MASNYEITVSTGNYAQAGINHADVAILLIGDSNMCGDGGDINAILDATDVELYHLVSGAIVPVDTSATPYIDHANNIYNDEVGPDLPFMEAYALNRATKQRVIGLGAGSSGSGFSTNVWLVTQWMHDHMKTLVNDFRGLNPFNTVGAVMVNLGANDTGDYTNAVWQEKFDTLIHEVRDAATFNASEVQNGMPTIPIVVNGLPPDWYTGVQNRQDIHDIVVDTPNRETYVGYATTDNLKSQIADPVHISGAGSRFLGGITAWDALLAAELNT